MTRLDRLLHALGFHSVSRCAQLHIWRWVEGKGWQAAGSWTEPRTAEPATDPAMPGLPTRPHPAPRPLPPMPPRKGPDPGPETQELRAVRPPGRHRPRGERIRPPSPPEV